MKKGIFLLLLITLIASCIPKKEFYYFSKKGQTNTKDSIFERIESIEIPTHTLSSGDELEIEVNPINIVIDRSQTERTIQKPIYTVNQKGFITLPILGSLNVLGFTTSTLQDTLIKVYQKFYKEPYVSVFFKSFRVVIMGEVRKPGTILILNDHASLLDVISLAGDLSDEGKRVNVKVFRKQDSISYKEYMVDLTSISAFKSEAFYLRSNDIIYVSSITAKRIYSRIQIATIAATSLNLLISIISLKK